MKTHTLLALAALGLAGLAWCDDKPRADDKKDPAVLLDTPQGGDLLLFNGGKRLVYLVRLTPDLLTYKQSANGTEVVTYAARDGHVVGIQTTKGEKFVWNKATGAFEAGPPSAGAGKAEGAKLNQEEQAIIDLVNKEREKENLPPLVPHEKLVQIARAHSLNMAKQNRMDHTLDGKNPIDRAKEVGYQPPGVAENVAWGARTPDEVVRMWMNSPGHRANILGKQTTEVGIGVGRSGTGGPFYTLVLGFRRPQ